MLDTICLAMNSLRCAEFVGCIKSTAVRCTPNDEAARLREKLSKIEVLFAGAG